MKKLILATVCVGFAFGACAANYCHWCGSEGGDWWDKGNWLNGNVPSKAGDIARFGNATSGTPGCLVKLSNPESLAADYILVEGGGEFTLDLCGGTLTLPGTWDNPTIRASGGDLKIRNGKLDKVCYTASGTSRITFEDVVNTDAITHRREVTSARDDANLVIEGGRNAFKTFYARLYAQMLVKDGITTLGSLYGHDKYGEGKQNVRLENLRASGGKAVITRVGADNGTGTSGLGVGVSGNGFVDIWNDPDVYLWLADRNAKRLITSDRGWLRAPLVKLLNYDMTTNIIETAGGRLELSAAPETAAASTYAHRASFTILNGGILDFNISGSQTLTGTKIPAAGYDGHHLQVGTNRTRLRNRNSTATLTVNNGGFESRGDSDAGLVFEGAGKFVLSAASTMTGDADVRANVTVGVESGAFGTGAVTIHDGGMLTADGTRSLPALTYEGGAWLSFNSTVGRFTGNTLTRSNGGVIGLVTTQSRTAFGQEGENSYLKLTTAPAMRTCGIPVDPVILFTKETGNSAVEAHLAGWDAESGKFVGATYTEGVDGGANSVAYCNANSTVLDSDKAVAALVIRGNVNGSSSAHKFIVGDGVNDAIVIYNGFSNGKWAQVANAALDFGSAHGIIAGGSKVSGVDGGCTYHDGDIITTAGITFMLHSGGGIKIYRTPTYSGGTQVVGGEVLLQASDGNKGGFGSGTVEVLGGEYTGGTVRFMCENTHAQDYVLSGFGAVTGASKKGALSFESDTTLAGSVTLTNDTLVTVADGVVAKLPQGVTGTGDFHVNGEGTLETAAIDIVGDLHVGAGATVKVSGTVATGTGFIFVEEGGTLELDNADAVGIVVNGRLMGAGTLKLAGRGAVTLDQDLALFYDDGGTLDYDSSVYRMKRSNGSLVFKPKTGMMLLVR